MKSFVSKFLEMNNKSVSFLLGGLRPTINGGTKVILEYANRLSENGWQVSLVYGVFQPEEKGIFNKIYHFLSVCKTIYKYGRSVKRWFHLNDCVKEIYVNNLDYNNVPYSDIYIATYVSTAPYLNKYPIDSSRKYYFIQDYEVWGKVWTGYRTRQTYGFSMTKFVISDWLKELLKEEGADSIKLANGFDFNFFKYIVPFDKKDKYSITILYSKNPHKGVSYALKAVRLVKERYPQLKVKLFGTYSKRPEDIDDWMEYNSNPDKNTLNLLYNESAIYVAASTYEGWGLTIGEAMICGAAIACTDTDGFKEMVSHGETGLISPVGDIGALASNVCKLIEDDQLRYRLANNGNLHIQNFTWDNSVMKMIQTFENHVR